MMMVVVVGDDGGCNVGDDDNRDDRDDHGGDSNAGTGAKAETWCPLFSGSRLYSGLRVIGPPRRYFWMGNKSRCVITVKSSAVGWNQVPFELNWNVNEDLTWKFLLLKLDFIKMCWPE